MPSQPPPELTQLALVDAMAMLRRKAVSPVELARAFLARIERWNPALNAFITVTAEQALQQARQAETEISRGHWRGPLHGIPLALKDLIDTAGIRTTAGSAVFKDRIPSEDAEVVRRLKAAGAVLLGKLNMHEFAYGGTSVPSRANTALAVASRASRLRCASARRRFGVEARTGTGPAYQ